MDDGKTSIESAIEYEHEPWTSSEPRRADSILAKSNSIFEAKLRIEMKNHNTCFWKFLFPVSEIRVLIESSNNNFLCDFLIWNFKESWRLENLKKN